MNVLRAELNGGASPLFWSVLSSIGWLFCHRRPEEVKAQKPGKAVRIKTGTAK